MLLGSKQEVQLKHWTCWWSGIQSMCFHRGTWHVHSLESKSTGLTLRTKLYLFMLWVITSFVALTHMLMLWVSKKQWSPRDNFALYCEWLQKHWSPFAGMPKKKKQYTSKRCLERSTWWCFWVWTKTFLRKSQFLKVHNPETILRKINAFESKSIFRVQTLNWNRCCMRCLTEITQYNLRKKKKENKLAI